ncbi:MmcQ/YjbR family DNA-binding protein [uncultured Nevskia sp.]|uniref:MmcQ/YjbR family DNA-binding protein n=1 Tax=uncultured Nevskia sp. TaxID=228950 RepID=UPI0025FE778E|nr:MmcQ/YjbR family DNA-binding protein [uncultured Nevskia sp.]
MTVVLSWQAARELALSLPDAEQRDHFGSPSFRVKGKIFAQLSARDSEEQRVLVKLPAADQAALTMSDPDTFLSVPQWGQHGWTYVQLATVEESMLRGLLIQSWRQVAPKKLVAAYEAHKRNGVS